MSTFRRRRQEGMALVLVLWLIVLLSVIASGHSRNARIEAQLAARHADTVAARNVAEGIVQLAILELLLPDTRDLSDTIGRPQTIHALGRDATLTVRRATGLVDLNGAGEDLLYTLFTAAGAGDAEAQQLAEAVMDWRDPDGLARLHGAEDGDYAAAGVTWRSRDADFETIEELRYVMGMTPAIYRAVTPYVTVHSGHAGIDLDAAPPALQEILSRSSPATIDGARLTSTFHIAVSVSGSAGTLASVEAVVNVHGSGQQPFQVLEWREAARASAMADEDPFS